MSCQLRVLTAVAAFALFAAAPCFAADDEVVGKYNVAGRWAGGKEYSGTVLVTKRGDSYEVQWIIGDDKPKGVGILDGDVLAVNFAGSGDGDGVMLLHKKNDKWVGK